MPGMLEERRIPYVVLHVFLSKEKVLEPLDRIQLLLEGDLVPPFPSLKVELCGYPRARIDPLAMTLPRPFVNIKCLVRELREAPSDFAIAAHSS